MVNHHSWTNNKPFQLESGATLPEVTLAYSTFGELSPNRDNVIWVCHALTGGSNVKEWWPEIIGKGCLFDPTHHFIICANMLGGCYGSTGPLSINPKSGSEYFHDFPFITNRDIVNAFDLLRKHLNIERVKIITGGSMGGQQAIEWCVIQPGVFENLVALATNARHSPWGIAFNESQRMAIEADTTWSLNEDKAGMKGMEAARAMGMMSYRCYASYELKQTDSNDPKDNFKASSYQKYQGEKLTKRFNAYTYWTLSKAMDSHNIGRNRGGFEKALAQIKARSLFIGIDSDLLFPIQEQQLLNTLTPKSELEIVTSKFGHDGFLIEMDEISAIIKKHLDL
ncbi:MAG: homoserine O-acetyltransferase [Cyclobacteriaceae bacterium]